MNRARATAVTRERVLRPPSWWNRGPDPTAANLDAAKAMGNLHRRA